MDKLTFTVTEGNVIPGRYIWKCSICGHLFCWGPDSWQYGDMDDAWAVTCSDACQKAYKVPYRAPPLSAMCRPVGVTTETGSRWL